MSIVWHYLAAVVASAFGMVVLYGFVSIYAECWGYYAEKGREQARADRLKS